MAEEVLNLQQKLSKIRKMTEVIQKNRKGFNYKYTSIDEILARVTAGMNKYNVSLIPSIVPGSESVEPYTYCKTKFTKDGQQYEEKNNEFTAKAGIVYTWVNDDDPTDRIDVPWFIAGSQADPAQAVGSGLYLRPAPVPDAVLPDRNAGWRRTRTTGEANRGLLKARKTAQSPVRSWSRSMGW